MSDEKFVASPTWCGFDPPHPPHLWGEVQQGLIGRWVKVFPCPGKPFDPLTLADATEAE